MQSQLLSSPCGAAAHSPTGWRARGPRPSGSPGSCGTPQRLSPSNAVAGVGSQASTVTTSPSSTSTSYGDSVIQRMGSRQPNQRPANGPLQILVKAATQARVTSLPAADVAEITNRLAGTNSWPALQVLALKYQGRLDQQGIVAMLRRAAHLAANTTSPSTSEQYACARFLESIAMCCANAIPSMSPSTVAAVLGTLGALASSGMIVLRQVPYMVVVLVQALILASLPQLHLYSGPQLAYVLRGCALLSPSGLPEVWLDEWQAVTTGPVLAAMPPDALDAVVAALQALYSRQNWLPADRWLGDMLLVVEQQLEQYGGDQLRQLAIALAGLEVRPHNGWLGNFRAAFDRQASTDMDPHDVAGVLYAFTKLEVAFA